MAVGLQNELWDLPPSNTENRAGKLKLCIGMPIMIKYNEATECGVTNGAEGSVVGWKARNMDSERQFLQVLFVKLTSAPVPIKLDGLPENVVPITYQTIATVCERRNGKEISVIRSQVPVLLNFAMTDFNSQG